MSGNAPQHGPGKSLLRFGSVKVQASFEATKKRLADAAMQKAVGYASNMLERAALSVIGEGVPRIMAEPRPIPDPPESDVRVSKGNVVRKPGWKDRPKGASFKHEQSETIRLADIMATLAQQPWGNAREVENPPIGNLSRLYSDLAKPVVLPRNDKGIVVVGMYSIAALDAATQYRAKMVIYPGPYDESSRHTRWMWWVDDHWEANAFVLRPDGSVTPATVQTNDLFSNWTYRGVPSDWRAAAAKGHGYWADVEWGCRLPHQGQGPGAELARYQPGARQSLLGLVDTRDPSAAVTQGREVTQHPRTFLVGNRPYLILTRIAAEVRDSLMGNSRAAQPEPKVTTGSVPVVTAPSSFKLRGMYDDGFDL